MDNITEYGCEQCGAQIMKPTLTSLESAHTPPLANHCDECGRITDPCKMHGFQCSTKIYSWLGQLNTLDEFKQLRLDPNSSVLSILNARLVAAGKQALEVDSTTRLQTIREKL